MDPCAQICLNTAQVLQRAWKFRACRGSTGQSSTQRCRRNPCSCL